MLNFGKPGNELPIVTFDISKLRNFDYFQCKTCFRKLASRQFTVAINNGRICSESLFKSQIFVFLGSRENLEIEEICLLRKYIERGGKLLVMDNCGKSSNINLLLDTYGIHLRNDSVIRTHRCKNYFHPCESFISDGIVNEAIYYMETGGYKCSNSSLYKSFPFLYTYGCTLNVKHPSVVLMSTGNVCFPFSRPICAFYRDTSSDGKIIAIGSTTMFLESSVHKEQNLRLFQVLVTILSEKTVNLNIADLQSPDIVDYAMLPCIARLSDQPFCYLQDIDENPVNFSLLKDKIFQFKNRHVVKVIDAYKDLNIEHKSLKIIRPKFESPLPEIAPALMPPRFRDLAHPALELMDLDEFFMSAKSKLPRLTFKCTDDDLDYYIMECGKVLDIPEKESAKSILYYACSEMSRFKRNIPF